MNEWSPILPSTPTLAESLTSSVLRPANCPESTGSRQHRGGRLARWRLPREPSKLRHAVVVEDHALFPDGYPDMLVVPLTRDEGLAHRSFAEQIEPTAENGAETTSWALAHHVTSVSLRRVTATNSRVTPAQLANIRERVALAIGR